MNVYALFDQPKNSVQQTLSKKSRTLTKGSVPTKERQRAHGRAQITSEERNKGGSMATEGAAGCQTEREEALGNGVKRI